MSGKFRIATVLVVLGLLLTACAAPASARPPLRPRRRPQPSRQNLPRRRKPPSLPPSP